MSAVRAGVLLAWLLALVASPATAQAQSASPGAAPPALNLVRVKLKPRTSGAYAALESQIVRAYERAKVKVYWICLQVSADATEVLYLNLYESAEAVERTTGIYNDAIKQHPELPQLQQRLSELTASTTSMLTARRDDIDRAAPGVDFATMRTLRLTTFQVRPGHEGAFLNAIRTTHHREGSWLVYEANESSTFVLVTLKRTALTRADGPAIPRTLRRLRSAYTHAESRVFNVRPAMSHVSQAFVAANPQLWRAVAASH